MRAKIAGGQREEALIFARKNQNVGVQDAEFVDAWLGLEAVAVGGDRAKALQMRDQLAKRSPDNERNNVSLVMLLLDAQRWADARTMIDKLRGSADRPSYVELDVRWSTAQNNMRNAIETFNRWVTTLPADKHTEAPYISLAGIFMDYGKYDAAILSLEDGRKHQDPKTMGADRKLGEVQFLTQRYAQCIETYNRVLAADPKDPEYRVSGQIVEAYIRLSKFADAKKLIDALGGGVESNSRMLLLKAEILAGLGQLEEAGRTYDAAVAAAKEDPIGYIKRAEFLGRDPQRMGDAQQDLRQALALSPRLLGARRLLTDLHMRRNEPDKAVEVLREGLRADPDNDAPPLGPRRPAPAPQAGSGCDAPGGGRPGAPQRGPPLALPRARGDVRPATLRRRDHLRLAPLGEEEGRRRRPRLPRCGAQDEDHRLRQGHAGAPDPRAQHPEGHPPAHRPGAPPAQAPSAPRRPPPTSTRR